MTRRWGEPSGEFRLVAACCRWPTDVAAIRAAADAPLDWPRVVMLARRHRVVGFVHLGLAAGGIEAPPRLAKLYDLILGRNLLHYGEAVRLAGRLAAAGIPAAFLKGVVLAELAYGDQGVKQTVDNDLLVAPENVAATIDVLAAAGYRLNDPPGVDTVRLPLLIELVKECQLVHPTTSAIVDLHWRMHSLKQLLDEPDVADEARTVQVSGAPVPTLIGDTLMIYLAIHGARHCWSRLKWLADFNALLVKMDDVAVAEMRRRAWHEGVGPCVDSALAQCDRLLGTAVPGDLYKSRRVRWLVALSDRLIFGPDEVADQHQIPARYMRIGLASAVMMKSRPRYLAHLAWDTWVATSDALAVPLPKPLHSLYLVISPARRMTRVARRGAARLAGALRIGAKREARARGG